MRTTYVLIAGAVLVGWTAPPALAQSAAAAPGDAWTAWHGCWRADDDVAGTGSRVCVVPGEDGGTRWVTLVGAQRLREERRIADGVTRPVTDGACRGSEASRWSAERQRLYHTASVTCGSEPARRLASVAYLLPGPRLVEVQTVTEGTSTNVRVQRLRPSTNQALPDGTLVPRTAAAGAAVRLQQPWTVADVIEASAQLPADGVQAALMEGPTAFSLTKTTLIAMADAHVAEPVIDLMVATTYPKHFVVQSAGDSYGAAIGSIGSGWVDPFYAPILGPASLYDCYSPYSWASSAYWRQCNGYNSGFYVGYPGYYRGYYGDSTYFNGPWYLSTPEGTPASAAPRGEGRVVNGRGYTQIVPVDTGVPGQMMPGGQVSGQSTGGTSSGSTSGATSSGYSGGGGSGGGDGGRTAVPRPPGP